MIGLLASIARLRFADKGIINLWNNESKASIIERQGVGYLVVSPLGSTPFNSRIPSCLKDGTGCETVNARRETVLSTLATS